MSAIGVRVIPFIPLILFFVPVPVQTQSRLATADRAELEAFLDGAMSAWLNEKEIVGATLSAVRDGDLLFAKGYGYGDVERRVPVDPERTLFRIGSVTKLFTYTAVMQLVEQGRLDLGADINDYLDFPVPATYAEPVTLTHLLTHTAGFEDDLRDLFTESIEGVMGLGAWLEANMPARVRPPGRFSAYSNYGTALAGYIVERVSGMSWDDYIETRLLQPLGMASTTGRQPLPHQLAPNMSQGFARSRGRFDDRPWEFMPGDAPAGSISSTATDMAKFMLAHLGDGAAGDVRVLAPETARRMHTRIFGHDERIPGYAHGFYEMSSHGMRVIGHAGSTRWFHTLMLLFPADDVGIFVSFNTETAVELTFGPVVTALLDHFAPVGLPPVGRVDPGVLAQFTGHYRFNRMSFTTYQKALGLIMGARVTADDGFLVAATPFGVMRFGEMEPGLFREELGHLRVAFRMGGDGRSSHAFLSVAPMMALERVSWHGTPGLHFMILGGGMVIFAGIALVGTVQAIRRRLQGEERHHLALVRARRTLMVVALANVGFLIALATFPSDQYAMLTSPFIRLRVALAFPVIGALAATGGAVAVIMLWRERAATIWTRIRYSAAVMVALAFSWSLNYWNLLGWRM